jgi:uncharacterized protein YjdB
MHSATSLSPEHRVNRRVVRWLLGLGVGAVLVGSCKSTTAPPTVASIAITPDTIRLILGDSVTLAVVPLDGSGHLVTGISVTFRSADTVIATVTIAGTVRAKHIGITHITISGGGVNVSVPTIISGVSSFTIVPDTIRLIRGDTVTLTVTPLDGAGHPIIGIPLTFVSADASIATVTLAGQVRASHSGTTHITVSGGGDSANVPTFVTANPVSLTVGPADTAVREGATFALRVAVFDSTSSVIPGAPLTFNSNDTTIAQVSPSGDALRRGLCHAPRG